MLLTFAMQLHAQQAPGRYTLSGTLELPATTATLTGLLDGIELVLTNETGATVVVRSNSSGGYLFTNVTTGVFTITPRRAGTRFSPSVTTVSVTTDGVRVPTFTVFPDLPVISGRIIMANDPSQAFPFANITITLPSSVPSVPLAVLRPRVNVTDGTFSIPVSTAGTYSIQSEASSLREGFIIVPNGITPSSVGNTNASTSVSVDFIGNVLNNRFTFVASQPTYRITGSVLFQYEPSAAFIDVVMISPTGTPIKTVAQLNATVTGDPFTLNVTNASYRITSRLSAAQADFYVSKPREFIVNIRSRDTSNLNFEYEPRRISISGKIVRISGNARIPVGNLPIRLAQFNTNNMFDSTQTSSDGSYTLSVRALDNTLPLVLLLPPSDYTYTYNDAAFQLRENVVRGTTVALYDIGSPRENTVLNDIIATPVPPRTYKVPVRVIYSVSGEPVREPLTLIVTNATNVNFPITEEPRRIRVDDNGNYVLNVTAGNYTVSVSANRHIFPVALRRVDIPREDGIEQTFRAVLEPITVSGVVQTIVGMPITNANVRIGGGFDEVNIRTDANGFYRATVPNQYPGNRFFIIPSTTATTLYPPARLVLVDVNSQVLNNMDFRATATLNTLSLTTVTGRITIRENGQDIGLAGVTISDGTRSAKTDANGVYTMTNVPNGSYTFTPSLEGYAFTPTSLNVSVIGGIGPRGQNFVGTSRPNGTNSPPRLISQPNDIPVIAATTTRVPILSLFTDANGDALSYSMFVEDPTILRTRMENGFMLIDALTEGNTMVNIVANDNRGGTVTASFRVTVNRPAVAPRIFTRPKGNINTNFNAAILIKSATVMQAVTQMAASMPIGKENALQNSFSGELGAFNANCDCVGSVVWTGADVVIPVWSEDKANGIPGMRPNEPINIRFVDNIERKSRRGQPLYVSGGGNPAPGLWPIDQGVIDGLTLTDDPCIPTINSVFSAQTLQQTNSFRASLQPNPIQSRAQLSYTLPVSGNVTVELWNTLGQKMETLYEGMQSAGEQRLDVNVDALPTGMYICRIRREGALAKDVSTIRISVIR